jgi:glycosyltransferase involved in cell wall biosynthesis
VIKLNEYSVGPIIQVGEADPASSNGVAKTIHEYLTRLHTPDWAVENWVFDCRVKRPTRGTYDGKITQWRLPATSRLTPMLPQITREWLNLRKKENPKIHLHSVFTPHNNALAETLGGPFLVTPNGGWQPRVLLGRRILLKLFWILIWEQRLWRKAAFVCAVSKAEMKNLQKLPGMSRVVYTPNAVDVLSNNYQRDGYWLYLGRLAVDQKGIDQMIGAYGVLKAQGMRPPAMLLAGPDFRDGRRRMQAMVNSLGLSADVKILEEVTGPAKERLLQGAAVFCHTSRWEGIPHAVLEALAHGVPCLLTKETNLGIEVKQAGAGWCCLQGVKSVAESMRQILVGAEELPERSVQAHNLARERFAWPETIEKLKECYLAVTKR